MSDQRAHQDDSTTLRELRNVVAQFVRDRDWNQFHSPKNLSMSLAIEAAELMEHFQWISIDDSRKVTADPEKLRAIADEVADVFCYTLAIVNELNLDLSDALSKKMHRNQVKYPVKDFRGRFGLDDPNAVGK
jgi:NTP pyrophosphatase (non-canonical NTP hydrolase)